MVFSPLEGAVDADIQGAQADTQHDGIRQLLGDAFFEEKAHGAADEHRERIDDDCKHGGFLLFL